MSKRFLPTYCQRDEKIFRTVILKAASHHIPTGRHRLPEGPVPAEILDVMTRRDGIHKRDLTSPEQPKLNYDIQNRIYAHKRQRWGDFVETLGQKTDVTKLWRTINGIDGRAKREAQNETITFNGISYSPSKQLATKFNHQFYTSKLGIHTSSSETRLVTRETKRKSWDLRKEPARWRSLGLVLHECLPPTPPPGTPIIGSNTCGSCPLMSLSSLKDIQYSYSFK